MSYAIDDGIPAPPVREGRRVTDERVTLEKLEVGQSFAFPIAKMQRVRVMITDVQARTGRRFTTATIDLEVGRAWRIS
jgi:hypothetical protein